jgi:glutamate-1-semialdehyde 2,1-aminomutase
MPPILGFGRSIEATRRLERLVPGGAHTYAKGADQFPDGRAPVLVRGEGCHVWDVDGNTFIEYGMGLRAVTLGHAFPPVVRAVQRQAELGSNFVRPSLLELEAAEAFLGAVPSQDMVKFTKDGSTANSAAVRLARAVTGRRLAAICTDQPFFSYDDWAMGRTSVNAGIPAEVSNLTLGFRYNDRDSVKALFADHPGAVACVMLEPERDIPPREDFLRWLRDECTRQGALLVFDENVTGFRWHLGGAQAVHRVTPDLSSWGKGMSNGFGLSALAGRRSIMQHGDLQHEGERVFLLSTTHGAEHLGLAAMIAVIDTYRSEPVIETLLSNGALLRAGISEVTRRHGLDEHFILRGRDCLLLYEARDETGTPSQLFRTLFLQETISRGLLAPSFVVSFAHTVDDIDRTVEVVDAALSVYRQALEGGVETFLRGRPTQAVYRRRDSG